MKIDIGRNDQCPCGSGLKFKKCCLSNPINLFPKHLPERRWHWSQEEIREIPTDKIIEKLEMCGVSFNQDEFLISVETSNSARDISREWKRRFTVTAKGYDEDFIWMGSEVLWERFSPNKKSMEQIDDMMNEGHKLIQEGNYKGGCDIWIKVWDELKLKFKPTMNSIQMAGSTFDREVSFSNWCQDFEMELGNAGRNNKHYLEYRITYCREFCAIFPANTTNMTHNMKRAIAESLYNVGRVAEGENEFRKLISDFPDNPWGYIAWGDMYSGFEGESCIDRIRAEELYTQALGLDPEEDETIRERIQDLKKR